MNIHLHFHLDNLQKHHCFSSVQFSSLAQSCLTLCNPMNCSTPGLLVHYQLPAFTQTHVHRVGNAIQPSLLCCPLLLLPLIPPRIRVFSNESALHMKWPKYWSFSFSIGPSNEHPGLISFRMDWLDLLAVQAYWHQRNTKRLTTHSNLNGEGSGNQFQYSCLRNPRTGEPSGLKSMESQKVRHALATKHIIIWTFIYILYVCDGEENGNPLQQSCLDHPMNRGARRGYRPLGCKRVGHDWVTQQ